MTQSDLEQRLMAIVTSPGYKPVKPKVLAKRMNLDDEETRQLKKLVKRLVKRGQLSWGSNHLVQPGGDGDKDRVIGIFRKKRAGFGFVRPQSAAVGETPPVDIFIPERRTMDAANGDLVAVKLSGRPPRGEDNPTGQIIDIIERETHEFVGAYFETGGEAWVKIDGDLYKDPIFVGDPGAKNAQPGDKVVIEMVRFPTHVHYGEAVILEVLGPRGAPGVDTLSIIREFGLPGDFPEAALEESRSQAERFDERIEEPRRDLTQWTVLTIDPQDARDFDDAISLEKVKNDHWRLGVHIADVSHFVQVGTPLDDEARDRATSVYLPDRVIPMLPEVISNNLASLQPDRVRYSMTALMDFTPEGVRTDVEVFPAAIRSDRRFTYEEVDDFLANRAAWKEKLAPDVHRLLDEMHTLAMILRGRRMDRGSMELHMPEVKIDLDKHGRVAGAHLVENTESHQIIEEFMLAANEAVAEWLRDQEILFLRRIHESPDPRKLHALTQFVRELGIECESLESRFEIERVLEQVKGQPEERAVNYAVLRSLQKAIYSPKDVGHFALASDCYCHFTSPIRRYPDLTVHRLYRALIEGKKPVQDLGQLYVLGEHCSERERRAEEAERELIKVKLLLYLSEHIGTQMDAVITGVERFGLFAQGIQMPAEGLIHIQALQDDYYNYDEKAHTLTGRRTGNTYRLGDLIRVEVARVDIDERQLDFRFIKRLKHAKLPAVKKKKPRRSAKTSSGKRKAKGKKKAAGKKTTAKRKTNKDTGKKSTAKRKTKKGRKKG